MMDDMKIGGLHGELGLDVREWFAGFEDAREALSDFANEVMAQFKELESKIRNVGLGLTAAITVPFAGVAVTTKRGAGAFEKSMNNVNAALRGIRSEQLEALSEAAQKLGPQVGRSATEAADGIETLALAGMAASDILDGGLTQTLRLAAANAADLGQSAAVVTDVMAQFGKNTDDLGAVVNNITGALDASKLGFNDFKDAIAQGGGVAGAAGVSFEDFNTALAGTAALFGSGSDAGTSFKTFITTLTPKSKEAAAMMERLGLDFYDATGKMKGLADIAEMLREKLGNLSDRSRTNVMNEIFGADAMRTAIGLMRLGGQAFEDLQTTIGRTDAGEKLAIQMRGVEEASKRLSGAFESLQIALGETGILGAFTAVIEGLTGLVQGIANLNPVILQIGVAIWGFAAALGPLTLAVITLAKIALPLAFGQLGLFGKGLALLINPVGVIVSTLGRLAISLTGVSAAFGLAGNMLLRLAGPIGLVITALTLFYLWSNRTVMANSAARQAAANAATAYEKQQAAALGLVSATGQARKAIIDKMKADRAAELQAMATARADVTAARAALERAKANLGKAKSEVKMTARGDLISPKVAPAIKAVDQAEADLLSRAKTLETVAKTVEGYTRAINTPEFTTVDLQFDEDDDSGSGKSTGPTAQELANRREQMKLEQQMAVARARDDKDQVRRIQDKIDIFQRQRDYEDAGLAASAAKLAAEKDIAEVKAAEAEYDARQVGLAENALDQQLAEIRGDEAMARLASDKAYLEERTTFWQGKGLTLLEAQKRAAEDLVQVDVARADAAAKLAKTQALDREAELSRLRNDTAAQQRAASRASELNRRTEQYYRDGEGKVSEDQARDRAETELNEEEMARQQGQWRDTIRGGLRAALDGDVGGFVSNWWKDNVARGMEEALNSLSDVLFSLFRQAFGQGSAAGGAGAGGFLGSIVGGFKGIFGPGTFGGGPNPDGSISLSNLASSIPKFNTGGSFEVGGKPGIDTNLVQFWGTAGETVNIRRGNDSDERGGNTFMFQGNLMTPEFWAQVQTMDSMASAQAVGTTERRASRRQRRRAGR